ncbi:MAG TPA: shikimate kinase [Candidatus Eisenbacteria bacterium]|nr:shikimate kinase [Candidatus Eisenbacteria bacterium]
MPGAGKSIVAPLLAARLGFTHVDLDQRIERDEQTTVADVIRSRGEEAFRALEARALGSALEESAQGVVIACGGGILGRDENRERLARAFVLWLLVTPETAAARMGSAGRDSRPLLNGGSVLDRLRSLEAARSELYRRAASATVDTEGRSAAEVADLAAGLWRAWDSSAS